MNLTKHFIILWFSLFTFCSMKAQESSSSVPKITFDCAKVDNTISTLDLNSCKKMILTGSGNYEKVKIYSATVCISRNGKLNTFVVSYNIFSKELVSVLQNLKAGNKIIIEAIRVTVPDPKTGKNTIRKLEDVKLEVK